MPDLSLLPALDALLTEASVVRAARKVGLSPSAMSRTLDRLRATTGDALLVRAGRGLVLTPRAEVLRDRVRQITQDAVSLLQPDGETLDLCSLVRTFAIRANDGFVEMAGARLFAAARAVAPGVRLVFVPKFDKDARPLREGAVDLEIGVLGESGPEIRVQALFRDRFVGVARKDHPLFGRPITPESYAACEHVAASRRGVHSGPVDDALARLGLSREVLVVVPSFAAALALAMSSELVALLPLSFVVARAATNLEPPFAMFELPVSLIGMTVSQMWHPRLDVDAGHRWLRRLVIDATSISSEAAER